MYTQNILSELAQGVLVPMEVVCGFFSYDESTHIQDFAETRSLLRHQFDFFSIQSGLVGKFGKWDKH